MRIKNPIQEESVRVAKVYFFNQAWSLLETIEATDMNREERLFIEFLSKKQGGGWQYVDGLDASTFKVTDLIKLLGQLYFAELWDDCGDEKRKLIAAFRTCTRIGIVYKPYT
jgi:hypothetical protein